MRTIDGKVIFDPLLLDEILSPAPVASNDSTQEAVTIEESAADQEPSAPAPSSGASSPQEPTIQLLDTTKVSPLPNSAPAYDDSLDIVDVDELVIPTPSETEPMTSDSTDRKEEKARERDDDLRELAEREQASGNSEATSSPAPATTTPPTSPPVVTPPADDPINLVGTLGDDTLLGASGADTLDGGTGNDTLSGLAGDDRLLGNFGNDQIDGGDGDDYAFGGNGNDIINGGAGNDELRGGLDNDQISGGTGDDYLNGWTGDDSLSGGDGNDTLDGGDGDDTYMVDASAQGDTDQILDSAGNDILVFDDFNPFENVDVVFEDGVDLVFTFTEGGNLTLKNFYGDGEIETIRYNGQDYVTNADASSPISFADFINGTSDQIFNGTEANDSAVTGSGNDLLSGFGGDDMLNGGAGEDELFGGDGADTLNGGDDNDRILGEDGNDIGHGGAGDDYLFGDFGNDTLSGGAGNDELRGGFNNDSLFGDEDDDFLHGFSGNDLLDGGTGTDRLEGGTGRDTFIMRRGYGHDTIADYSVASAGVFFADKIDLSDFGLASFSDLVLSDNNGDAYIDLGGGDAITLEGVNSGNLSADDFSF